MEKEMQPTAKDGGGWRMRRWQTTAWAVAALTLLFPLATGAPWTGSDYAFAGVLLFLPLGIYELVARKTGDLLYRTGAGMALVATVLLLWVSGAVGITDSEADLLYFLALAVGLVGAFVAQFRPQGMAHAMFATALALVVAAAVALVAGRVPAHNSIVEILGITGFFVALFVGSAFLFRVAARRGPERRVI